MNKELDEDLFSAATFLKAQGLPRLAESLMDARTLLDSGPHWVSVKDRLPEPEVEVWAWDASRKVAGESYHHPKFDKNNGWHFGSYYKAKVTHWMPLPEAPK